MASASAAANARAASGTRPSSATKCARRRSKSSEVKPPAGECVTSARSRASASGSASAEPSEAAGVAASWFQRCNNARVPSEARL